MSATTDRIPAKHPAAAAGARAGLAVLAAVTTVAVIGLWPTGTDPGSGSDTAPTVARDDLAPYRPGGSVYDSQVPLAARDGISDW
jgi:hypothetical protein